METTHYFQRINIVDFCKLWFIYNFQLTKQKKKIYTRTVYMEFGF